MDCIVKVKQFYWSIPNKNLSARWTVKRGKATLRTSSKKNRAPQKVVTVLKSYPVSFPSSCEKVIYDTGLKKRGLNVLLGD